MPDNVQRGALEDFIRLLVPEEDKLWEYAEQTVKDISSEDRPKPEDGLNAENWDAKAKIHTWLAWREKPGQPIGEAINQRYLDPKAQEAQRFIAWVKLLFEIEEQV